MIAVNTSKLKTEYSRYLQGEYRPNVGKKNITFSGPIQVLVVVFPAPAFSALIRHASVTQRELRSRTDKKKMMINKEGNEGNKQRKGSALQ